MRVLVACEFSGRVREAFKAKGHDAWSCDLEPTEISGQHYQGDVSDLIDEAWDLMIAFPPCTYLAVSGMGQHDYDDPYIEEKTQEALGFVYDLLELRTEHIPHTALENPVGIISSCFRKPDQIIQPYQFGEPWTKRTCLWLKNMPKLQPTNIVTPISKGVESYSFHNAPPGEGTQAQRRSRTFQGIADAMAGQWTCE